MFVDCSEDTSAVHRKRGQQVEHADDQVEPDQPAENRAAVEVDRQDGLVQCPREQCRDAAKRHAGRRTDDGDRKFVGGGLGQILELRHAADRQQDNLVHGRTAPTRDETVGKFVDHDAGENDGEPNEAADGAGPALARGTEREHHDQEQKGHVDADVDTADAGDRNRPRRCAARLLRL
jgi:hypothetical protein